MAKTEKYKPEQVAKAITKANGMLSIAARFLGCDRKTVDNYVKKYEQIKQAQEEAREFLKDTAESKLVVAIKNREAWAICFYLKTQAKDRGYVERSEQKVQLTSDTLTIKFI